MRSPSLATVPFFAVAERARIGRGRCRSIALPVPPPAGRDSMIRACMIIVVERGRVPRVHRRFVSSISSLLIVISLQSIRVKLAALKF
jgi:hypothetical protein